MVCGYGAQDVLPFRPIKEGELFFVEDRDVNLVELALATNIPKGCAETMVRGIASVSEALSVSRHSVTLSSVCGIAIVSHILGCILSYCMSQCVSNVLRLYAGFIFDSPSVLP